ncbi:hypothetical protein IW138_005852 [Coemansia sp. RSA 986]|nr:hypothetical protein IW138_005852 [Coemansia sp. RSA 986]
MSLRILQQLGVYKIDDSAWADGDEWISESWLEREQIRRLIWGSFTIDTFLALMLHTPPFVLVDLSGVNRPCSQSVWYIGNDNLEALSYPDNTVCAKPGDSEYLKTLKKLKLAGMPWQSNGTTLQLNFSVLGNVILRGISDPQFSQDVLDRLVLRAFCSLAEWIALVPPMPEAPSYDEVHYTLLISSVALCLKSVITPYLIARVTDKQPNSISGGDGGSSSSDGDGNGSGSGSGSGNGNDGESPLIAAARATARYSEKAYNLPIPPPGARLDQELALEWMLKDYISTSCQVYRFMRHTHDMMTSNIVPPMFAAQTAMISGGIFAACAHSAPSESQRARFAMFRDYVMATCRTHSAKSLLFNISLTEIKRVDEMVRFMPRRLEAAQLKAIRSTIIPDSVESLVNKRFSAFVHSLRALTRLPMAPGSPESDTTSSSCPGTGNIPLTSNLCAIFGRLVKSSSSSCAEAKNRLFRDEKLGGGIDAYTSGSPSAAIPNYKLTYIAISSLMVALSLASKDESFLDFVPELRASSANGLPTTSTSQQQQQHRHQRPGTPTFSSSSLGQSQQRSKDLPVYSNGVGNSCTTATAFAWSLASRVCSSMAPQNAKQPEQQKQNTMPPPMSPNSVRSAPTPPPPTLALSPLSSDNSRPASQKPPSKPSNLVDLLN